MHEVSIVTGSILIAGLAFAAMVFYFRHRKLQLAHAERMALLEKGLLTAGASEAPPLNGRRYYLRGLLWSCSGVALIVFLLGVSAATARPVSQESILHRARELSVGQQIPLDQARQIVERDRMAAQEGMPKSLALLGLIPVAIGVAYLVFYSTDPARKLPPSP